MQLSAILKFNPNHDPKDGRFTHRGGGGKLWSDAGDFHSSLGLERKDMPQIRTMHHEEFFLFARGKGVSVSREDAKVSSLKPAQKHINPDQVAQMPKEALGYPVMVSKDNYVLDGTNRWARLISDNPKQSMKVIRIGLKAKSALALMKSFPKATSKDVAQVGATKKLDSIFKYDPNQPREPGGSSIGGQFASSGGKGVLHTGDAVEAIKALAEGRRVVLDQPRTVTVLLDKLAEMARDAAAKGEKVGTYDLCKVSVKGTNLFCARSKGIPRAEMPQLKGFPVPGSKASKLTPDSRGGADISAQFMAHLEKKGIKITNLDERADHLKASQNELNGGKVAGIMKAYEAGKLADERLFVSKDNYVVDGHHRWAAVVGADYKDGIAGDLKMKVARINMPIIELLKEANDFATSWGLPQVSVTDKKKKADMSQADLEKAGKKTPENCKGKLKRVFAMKLNHIFKYNPHHDKMGRFTHGSGGGGLDKHMSGRSPAIVWNAGRRMDIGLLDSKGRTLFRDSDGVYRRHLKK